MATNFAERLRKARTAAGFTQRALAEELGISRVSVTQWEAGQSMPESNRLPRLAKMLNTTAEWLLEEVGDAPIQVPIPGVGWSKAKITPGELLVGARDFPIYAATQGGNGAMIVHTDVMEYVRRPVILEGVPDSYGVLIVGDSMIPAYRPGDMGLVHPRRPLERDTDVVLYDQDHRTGDAKSMIKHLISFNDRSLKLEQYNPSKTFTEHRADWPICHQVVGMYKGRR